MKILSPLAAFLTIAATMSCRGGDSKVREADVAGQVSLSGAFALYPLAVQWSNEFQVQHPSVKIDVSAGGAGKGMTDVLNGMVTMRCSPGIFTMKRLRPGHWLS